MINISAHGERFRIADVLGDLTTRGIDGPPAEPEVDEFTYSPRVQEALDFIERETREYNRRERQRQCAHTRLTRIDSATVESPLRYIITCHFCGRTEEHHPPHEGPDACYSCLGMVMPPRDHPDRPDTKWVLCDSCMNWHEVSAKQDA